MAWSNRPRPPGSKHELTSPSEAGVEPLPHARRQRHVRSSPGPRCGRRSAGGPRGLAAPDPVSALAIAIDGRSRTDPPAHPRTLGCFLGYVAVEMPIRKTLGCGPADIAVEIRKSVARADGGWTDDVVTLVDRLEDVDRLVPKAFTDVPGYNCLLRPKLRKPLFSPSRFHHPRLAVLAPPASGYYPIAPGKKLQAWGSSCIRHLANVRKVDELPGLRSGLGRAAGEQDPSHAMP